MKVYLGGAPGPLTGAFPATGGPPCGGPPREKQTFTITMRGMRKPRTTLNFAYRRLPEDSVFRFRDIHGYSPSYKAETGSSAWGLPERLLLLLTPPNGDAVTFG
jgi:hypothetical protein